MDKLKSSVNERHQAQKLHAVYFYLYAISVDAKL